jgi:hypothetical protein
LVANVTNIRLSPLVRKAVYNVSKQAFAALPRAEFQFHRRATSALGKRPKWPLRIPNVSQKAPAWLG